MNKTYLLPLVILSFSAISAPYQTYSISIEGNKKIDQIFSRPILKKDYEEDSQGNHRIYYFDSISVELNFPKYRTFSFESNLKNKTIEATPTGENGGQLIFFISFNPNYTTPYLISNASSDTPVSIELNDYHGDGYTTKCAGNNYDGSGYSTLYMDCVVTFKNKMIFSGFKMIYHGPFNIQNEQLFINDINYVQVQRDRTKGYDAIFKIKKTHPFFMLQPD